MDHEADNHRVLRALLSFHDHYGRDAEGHGAAPPDEESLREIESFSRGELPVELLEPFFEKMADKPEWLAVLAGKLKGWKAETG